MADSIEDYVRETQKRVQAKTSKIRAPHVFDFNYVPNKPLMREELKPVVDGLLRYLSTGIPNHLLIVGSRGSGKTLSVRYLEELFRRKGLELVYVNCRLANSSYKILAHLLGIRARGYSFEELAVRFEDRYGPKTVVVLDEVDLITDRNMDILYFLSRSEAQYMTILLSNNPKWVTGLDQSVQSTLQSEPIYFRPYSAEELREILCDRAKTAVGGAPDEVLGEIAALTAKMTDSDVRVGINTLYYWAVEPETALRDNFYRAQREVVVDVVKSLHDKNLLILKAGAGKERRLKEVYDAYRILCRRYREEPFSYVHFCKSLPYLQSLGLVLLTFTKVPRTYAKAMQLTFPPEILDTFWRVRFG